MRFLDDQFEELVVETTRKRKQWPKKILKHAVQTYKAEQEMLVSNLRFSGNLWQVVAVDHMKLEEIIQQMLTFKLLLVVTFDSLSYNESVSVLICSSVK